MNIVHVIFSFPIEGAENMLVDISNEQAKTEKVSIIIINDEYNEFLLKRLSTKVNYFLIRRTKSSKNPFFLFRLWKIIFKERPSIIHCHENKIYPLILFWKNRAVMTVHDKNLPTLFLNKFKKVFAISKCVQADLFSRTRIKATLVYNGINIKAINTKRKGNRNNIFRIVQISRLEHKKKGQDTLLRAISSLIYEDKIDNIVVDFIGEGNSELFLKRLAKELKIESHVNFLGTKNRDFIYDCLCEYDLLVQPSVFEGFGLTVIEAMAAKIPVLVSAIDGPLEIINNGEYGFSFQQGNVHDCQKLIKLIISQKETLHSHIEKSHIRIMENFDIEKTAKEYIKHYQLLKRREFKGIKKK